MTAGGPSAAGSTVAQRVLTVPRAAPRRFAALAGRPWAVPAAGAMLSSRCVVFASGIGAFLALGNGPDARYDFLGLTGHLGSVGDALAAPVVHWDGVWYLALASHGYQHLPDAAYFPLYPLLIAVLATLVRSTIVAAVLISLAGSCVALVLLYELTALELGPAAARRTVYLLALFPMSLFLSAAYPESLFLCLEIGALLAARRGRWAAAGTLGALGAAARNSGILLLVPLVLLYLYGPRDDRLGEPALRRPPAGRFAASTVRTALSGMRGWRPPAPRFRLRADALWLSLVALGLLAVVLTSLVALGDPLASWHAEAHFGRSFEGPLSSLWLGAGQAIGAAQRLLTGHLSAATLRELALFGLALAAVVAVPGVLRRLPAAYGVYSAAALTWGLSVPEHGHPLASSPRYIFTVFPLFMWLGSRLDTRRRLVPVIAAFAIGLIYCSAMFATWHFVA
jgi:hypothetical protein